MSAATRRAAYRWIVDQIDRTGIWPRNEDLCAEVLRVLAQMRSAGAVVDDPGVAEHVDGEPPPAPCRDAACECHANGRQKAKVGSSSTNGTQDGGWEP